MVSTKKIIAIAITVSLLFGTIFGGLSALYVTGFFGTKYLPEILKKRVKEQSSESLNKWLKETEKKPQKTNIIAEESAVVKVVEEVSPSVVSIIITKDLPRIQEFSNPFSDPFLKEFFPEMPFENKQQQQPQKQEVGGGTGFIIDSSGLILTNRHVVDDSNADYTVLTNDGKKYAAKVVGVDPFNDIGMIKIKKKGLKPVKLADSRKVKIGQTVIAIGNALAEFRNTVSTGVISGLKRSIKAGGMTGQADLLSGVIQTDAAINFGNSGGPLLNLRGEVIGINTAIASRESAQNIGFAIPINDARGNIESVLKYGRIVKPRLGVRYVLINDIIKEQNKLSVNYGALVIRGESSGEPAVIPGSAADNAGLQENDIILELNGEKITEENPLATLIGKRKVGDSVTLKILRKGKEKTLKAKLEEVK